MSAAAQRHDDLTIETIEEALFSVPADISRQAWWRIGAALKSELPGADGLALFHDWSKTGGSYNQADCDDTWKSTNPGGGLNIGTLIYEAQQHGFKLGGDRIKLDEAQQAERQRKREAEHAAAATAKREQEGLAAKRANLFWNEARPAESGHQYLQGKGVRSHGLRVGSWPLVNKNTGEVFRTLPDALLIPINDARNGKLISLQGIMLSDEGDMQKRYLKFGRKRGGFHMIGVPPEAGKVLAFCEGYATGATIHELTGWPVIVCFDAANLATVAGIMREKFPNAGFLICADNDPWSAAGDIKNPGLHYGKKAAGASNGYVIAPNFQDPDAMSTDWNDLARLEGEGRARAQLLANPITSKPSQLVKGTPAKTPANNDNAVVIGGDTQPYEISEDAIALAFANTYSDRVRFDHDAGKWFVWDGARWALDKRRLAFSYARDLQRRMAAGDKNERALLRASVCRGIETFAQTDERISADASVWDADAMLLGTPGGTVDLRTGTLRAPDPADHITKASSVAPADGQPIRWLTFLDEVTGGDADLIRFLQQWAGYCLTGDTREQQLVFAYGPGGNGKGVFLNTLEAILGDYAVTAQMDTFTASKFESHPTELAMLAGARMVTASETDAGKSWNEARVKQMTGGDKITARFMRQDNFTFMPQFKLTIIGNHKPAIRNVDAAMRRRLNLVPFTIIPAQKDLNLPVKLHEEHGQILNWAIRGCLDWQANGLVRPPAVIAATDEYCASQDVLAQWIADRCVTGTGYKAQPTPLYMDWCFYARQGGEEPGTLKSFSEDLEKRGFPATRTNQGRLRAGIELRDDNLPF